MQNLSECRNCGAKMPHEQQVCDYCRSYQYFLIRRPLSFITESRIARKAFIYPLLMLLGLASFLVVYFGFFRKLSETDLIALTPYWAFTFLFGYFGYTSEIFLKLYFHKQAYSVRDAYFLWQKESPLWAVIYILVPVIPFKNPLYFCLWGGLLWVLYIRFFFVVIFPSL